MGIFSGIFGDSEKDSKTEINVENVYADKNNPQGRKIAGVNSIHSEPLARYFKAIVTEK